MIPLGIQKYFMIAVVVLVAALATATVSYRAAYHGEQVRRAAVEESLARTVAAYDELSKTSQAALDSVTRASAQSRALVEQRLITRERVLTAPDDQDGPVAPILRDAINSVR